jgi:hypothetical protein
VQGTKSLAWSAKASLASYFFLWVADPQNRVVIATWLSFSATCSKTIRCALSVETQLGYKLVKYLRSIELVKDYSSKGKGQGGFREDFQYYGKSAEI